MNIKNKVRILSFPCILLVMVAMLAFAPSISLAQDSPSAADIDSESGVAPYSATNAPAATSQHNLSSLVSTIIGYVNQALVLLMGIAIVMFVWYVIQYFIKPNEDRRGAGMYVMYSLVGFFVMLSFWGLVNILQNTFGLQNDTNRPASWTSFTNIFPQQ